MPEGRWVNKKFDFDYPASDCARLLEELAAKPARLAELIEAAAPTGLVRRDGGRWSMQENVGHLSDVEALFLGRLDDYDAGLDELRPADMTNMATEGARYNEQDIGDLLTRFAEMRSDYLQRLQAKPEEYFARVAWHPRLEKPMRVVDQLTFQLAHDAHHLARIEAML